ncbi:hypothetical protein CONLIGDRAFT_414887 [Coniochaeta ligniaria NRRL 30616]|uniref:Uncharacterized protein n=1 Tax=Coniochaeta ligniaria NRRL 30616 TaxID=1408157 RepID=A0A1J7I436_9PEZI|nr:hypothetical protein CONLIGDRAFT_414887 [Coniochaeta ligniaria NRRL 30616]
MISLDADPRTGKLKRSPSSQVQQLERHLQLSQSLSYQSGMGSRAITDGHAFLELQETANIQQHRSISYFSLLLPFESSLLTILASSAGNLLVSTALNINLPSTCVQKNLTNLNLTSQTLPTSHQPHHHPNPPSPSSLRPNPLATPNPPSTHPPPLLPAPIPATTTQSQHKAIQHSSPRTQAHPSLNRCTRDATRGLEVDQLVQEQESRTPSSRRHGCGRDA